MNEDDDRSRAVQSTMIGPLWARAKYSQMYPSLLDDKEAITLMEKVRDIHSEYEEDFRRMEAVIDEFLGLAFVIRARTFDDSIMLFLEKNPNASIVNLGCGLDTTFSRIDNGMLHWFDLDLPEAITYRRYFIPEVERSKCIPKSIFDYSWMEDVNYNESDGLLVIAGGLFAYFKEEEISELLSEMAERFPGGEIIFDGSSARGNGIMNRRFKKQGIAGIDHKFNAKSPKQIERWSKRIKVIDWFSYFSRVENNPHWTRRTRLLMKLNSIFQLAKFVHLRFEDTLQKDSN